MMPCNDGEPLLAEVLLLYYNDQTFRGVVVSRCEEIRDL
jgi:hypothetical protein